MRRLVWLRGRGVVEPPTDSLLLWLKADAGTFQDVAMTIPATSDNDPVRALQDQSGNGYHCTQPYSVDRAPLLKLNILNGLPALYFDGVDDLLERYSQADFPLTRPATFGMIFAVSGFGTNRFLFGWGENGGAGNSALDIENAPHRFRQVRLGLGSVSSATALVPDTFVYQVVRDTGTTIYQRRNGAADGSGNLIYDQGAVGYVLGNTVGYWNNWYWGHWVELIAYNTALSDAAITQLEAYLAARSGI